MTDLRSAIYDDINEYRDLCEYYGEKPVTDGYGIDPYSTHAAKLKKRYRNRSIKKRRKLRR